MIKKRIRLFKIVYERYKNRKKEVVVYRHNLKSDKRVKIITAIVLVFVAAIFCSLYYVSTGNYLAWWFFWSFGAILALAGFSAPHFITLSTDFLTIHGYIDIDRIPMDNIVSVVEVVSDSYGRFIPLFASCGFLGIYGYFIYRTDMEIVKIHATRRSNWLVIKTKNDLNYIISVESPQDFLEIFDKIRK